MNRNVDPSLTGRTSPLLNDPSVAPRGFDPSTSRAYFGDGTSAQQSFGNTAGMFDRGTTGASSTGAVPVLPFPGERTSVADQLVLLWCPLDQSSGDQILAQRGGASH